MKHQIAILILFTLIGYSSSAQIQISGVEIPPSIHYKNTEALQLYGAGLRKFLWIDMYVGVIYLKDKKLTPHQIIHSNEPMALRLHIISSLISKKRTIKAIKDGFDKATKGNASQYQERIDQMIGFFKNEIQPNDIIDLVYKPSGEIRIYRNTNYLGSLNGLDFKQALFGMWLSENAVDKNMREAILNGI